MLDKSVFLSLFTVDRLERYVKETLTPSKNGKYVCPLCGSGEKEHHTGEFSINRKDPSHGRWTCFSCTKSGDLLDLIAKVNGITGATENEVRAKSIQEACQFFGIPCDKTAPATKKEQAKTLATEPETEAPEAAPKDPEMTLYADYLTYSYDNGRKSLITAFEEDLATKIDTPLISTGFNWLDEFLGGGLCEGLYTVGGISSVGKTSFVLQICDSIAENGGDVIIFSLEMSKFEMLAKTLSRKTFVLNGCKDDGMARTVRDLTVASRWKNYTEKQLEIIRKAEAEVRQTTGEIYLFEGIGDIGIKQVRKTVKDHIALTGIRPVVVIDYGQILAPSNLRLTDKQNTDYSVLEAKRMARDEKVPIVWISSFNRSSYGKNAGMEAFKESGGIEYTSDVAIKLQLCGSGDDGFNEYQAKRNNPREMEAVILKNRNGELDTVKFDYYPKFNFFQER